MDRIIEVKVGGSYLTKDNKNAGVRGEANVTKLRISFDEGWDEYAKTVTFWDARGENPVERILTTDLLENVVVSTRVYLVPIPAEPMAEAGMMTFVIDGYIEGKRQRSMSDKLEVKDAPVTDAAGEPADPTPSQAEQLQLQIDTLMDDIQGAVKAKEDIENMNVSCETLLSGEDAFVEKTEQEEGPVTLHFGLPAGEKGDKGDKGNTPAVVLRYDEDTGDLYYSSDGILIDKEYVESQNFATKATVAILQEAIDSVESDVANLKSGASTNLGISLPLSVENGGTGCTNIDDYISNYAYRFFDRICFEKYVGDISWGDYVGTGTYGTANKTLCYAFLSTPFLLIVQSIEANPTTLIHLVGSDYGTVLTPTGSNPQGIRVATDDYVNFELWSTSSSKLQLNETGVKYQYLFLGMHDYYGQW